MKFWHAMTRANADWLGADDEEVQRSQHDVHVTLVQFASYQDLLTKYLAGLSTKDLPDLFQPEDTTVQRMIDSQSVMPVQACVDADHYSLAKLLPRATAYFSFENVLYGMPWSLSNPILWYNKTAFAKAGLDPNKPPQTLEQVKEYSQKIVEQRRGEARHRAARRAVHLRVPEREVGRNAREQRQRPRRTRDRRDPRDPDRQPDLDVVERHGAAAASPSTPAARRTTSTTCSRSATGDAAMTMEASGVLGTVKQVLESGQYKTVRIATAPLPSINGGGGVPVGRRIAVDLEGVVAREARRGVAVHQVPRVRRSSRRRSRSRAATPRSAPTRRRCPRSRSEWAAEPIYRVSYDQLTTGAENAATAGSLIGDYQGVRDAVKDGMLSMLTGGLSPDGGAAEGADARPTPRSRRTTSGSARGSSEQRINSGSMLAATRPPAFTEHALPLALGTCRPRCRARCDAPTSTRGIRPAPGIRRKHAAHAPHPRRPRERTRPNS